MLFATQQHVRILNFHIPRGYLLVLDDQPQSSDLVEEEDCIVVTCSSSFNLSERTHREFFVRNIAAIVNYAFDSASMLL